MRGIYNSIAPLLDVGPSAPLYSITSAFSSLVLPASPIIAFNAYDYTTLTNGASWVNGGSWFASPVQPLKFYIDTSGRKYINFSSPGAQLTKVYTITTNMWGNSGLSFAFLMRINSLGPNDSPNNLFNTGVCTYELTKNLGATTKYLYGFTSAGGETSSTGYGVPIATLNTYIGSFMLVVQTQSGSTTSTYLNASLVGQQTGTSINTGGNVSGLITSCNIGY